MLKELQTTLSSLAEQVGPSVVGIGRRGRAGSGVVIDTDRILTNAHNLSSESVSVTFTDGTTVDGTVVGADFDADLAVIAATTNGNPPIERASSDDLGFGAPVVALSNPGGRGLRVTAGYVSGTQREFRGPRGRLIRGTLEHTAPLLPGSSGGPVVDTDGRLLGVNTNRLGEGFYLAIPTGPTLDTAIDKLSKGEAAARVRLGVGVAPADVAAKLRASVGLDPVDGVLVRFVEEGSPAEIAGIREGDMITKVGDHGVTSPDDLHEALASVGSTAVVEVVRVAETLTVEVGF
ncbi:MAG: S1C family serine protease [Acidimicrobiia bacterium]|nr:S1C family serine protease [Acidimicrobiia bacterium]